MFTSDFSVLATPARCGARNVPALAPLLLLAAPLLVAVPAHAGRSCESGPPTALAIERGMAPASRTTRDQAQAWLRFKGYTPSVLKIGTLTRLGARVGSAPIAFDDHPHGQRYAGRIATSTVDSALAWLARAQLAGPPVVLRLEQWR